MDQKVRTGDHKRDHSYYKQSLPVNMNGCPGKPENAVSLCHATILQQ
jgi:hypothetical protein